MPIYEVIPLMVLAGLGVAILAMLAMEAMLDNGDDHRVDLLLGSWGLFIALGIVLGHNFAAPRYLLPLMVPVAIVGTRVAERVIETRIIWWVAVALQTLLAVAVTVGEHGLAAGSDEVAKKLVEAHPEGGYFTGEWTFRWRMEQQGWTFYTGQSDAPWVASPIHSSPAELPKGWWVGERIAPSGELGIRVVNALLALVYMVKPSGRCRSAGRQVFPRR